MHQLSMLYPIPARKDRFQLPHNTAKDELGVNEETDEISQQCRSSAHFLLSCLFTVIKM